LERITSELDVFEWNDVVVYSIAQLCTVCQPKPLRASLRATYHLAG
jgi:hypothetical protein